MELKLPRDKKGRFLKGYRYSPQTEFKKGQHWRTLKPFWNKEWLEKEYQRKSARDIARDFGVSDALIIYWLRKHNIKRHSIAEIRKIKYWGLKGEKNPMFGRKGILHPLWKGGRTPTRQLLYSELEWKKISKLVRQRDKNTCQLCLKEFEPKKLEIHHRLQFSLFPEYGLDLNNLVLVCKECHKKLTFIDRRTFRLNNIKDFYRILINPSYCEIAKRRLEREETLFEKCS